jgi:hypothetical protein
MYVCVLNEAGEIVLHRDIKTDSEVFDYRYLGI